jgi:proteic killer suppression protein
MEPSMIRSFFDKQTEALFNGTDCHRNWRAFARTARRKLEMVHAAARLSDLKAPPNNKLEKLRRDRKGQHSIRINDQYRICFIWRDGDAHRVEITDYH